MAFAAARMIEQRNREKAARKTSNEQLIPPRGGRGVSYVCVCVPTTDMCGEKIARSVLTDMDATRGFFFLNTLKLKSTRHALSTKIEPGPKHAPYMFSEHDACLESMFRP